MCLAQRLTQRKFQQAFLHSSQAGQWTRRQASLASSHAKPSVDGGLSHDMLSLGVVSSGLAMLGSWKLFWSAEDLRFGGAKNFFQTSTNDAFQVACHGSAVDVPKKPEEDLATPADAMFEYDQKCYNMVFQEHGGPNRMGRLLIAPHGPAAVANADTVSFLRDLDDLGKKQLEMEGSFVCIFDIRELVWPSVFSLPGILRTVARHELSEPFKQRTAAFAILCKRGGWFETVINQIIVIKRAESIPILTDDMGDAERQLDDRLMFFAPAQSL